MFNVYCTSNGLPASATQIATTRAPKKQWRYRSQARDPVKGVKAKYQLLVLKEPPLRVIVGADTYKAIMMKIKAYKESDRRFKIVVLLAVPPFFHPFLHPFLSSADSPEISSIPLILPHNSYIHPPSSKGRKDFHPYV